MNKIIKLQNGSVFKLYNIPKIYFIKLKEEFIFEEINNIKNNSDIDIEFSSGIKSDIKSLRIFKEPVCIDKYGVFFIDQQGSIARIDFQIKKSKLIKLKVNSKFDTHFFYIIMLYLASISFLKNKGIFS